MRTLVLAQAWVGDVVLSQILYALLKKSEPAGSIDVLAPPWASALLERMPEVDRHRPLNVLHGQLKLKHRCQTGRQLRGQYDRAILIPRSFKAALPAVCAGIRHRIGFATPWPRLINDPRPRPDNISERMAQLLPDPNTPKRPLPTPNLRTDPEAINQTLQRLNLSGLPAIALAPGSAFGYSKDWIPSSYADLAEQLVNKGFRVHLLGSAREKKIGERIATRNRAMIRNLCGETTLDEAIDLLAFAQAAICNDSGLMHISAAVGTPVVGIYGPTDPRTHPPLIPQHAICTINALCSPCGLRHCPYREHPCMRGITVAEVHQKLTALLDA